MFRGIIFAFAVSLTLASTALAGGNNGGTKKDATIRVVNDTSSAYAVVIDASDALKAKLANSTATLDDLTAAGGKIIQANKEASFKVKAGSHRIGVVAVNESTGAVGSATEATRSVAKGKTLRVGIAGLFTGS